MVNSFNQLTNQELIHEPCIRKKFDLLKDLEACLGAERAMQSIVKKVSDKEET